MPTAKAQTGKVAGKRAASQAPASVDPARILARDVMRPDVLVLRTDDSVKSAAEQLEEIRASGAPVVDATGRLVGVLTLSDIARSEHLSDDGVTVRAAAPLADGLDAAVDEADDDEEVFSTEEYNDELLGRLRVVDWMTHGVIQVGPEATIAHVCRRMLDEAIHRVFVVERERLVGVVSTEDVVRLLAEPPKKGAGRGSLPR